MSLKDVQKDLANLDFDPGPIDGIYGPQTEAAIYELMGAYEDCAAKEDGDETGDDPIPESWLSNVYMERIIVHWTAGAYKANSTDKEHYHILVEDDGSLIRGDHTIEDNSSTNDNDYAAHTKNCNTESIGVSLCCMGGSGVTENPFNAGAYPMLQKQWDMLVLCCAQLCEHYDIDVTPKTILSHAEVEPNLGIDQDGKWDYTRLAFDLSVQGAKACGDKLRHDILAQLG